MIDIQDVWRVARTLPENRTNPMDESGSCLYSDPEGNHCIAGEILFRLGFTLPKLDDPNNHRSIRNMLVDTKQDDAFTDRAQDFLSLLQCTADNETHRRNENAWGFTVKHGEERYDAYAR